MEQLKTLQRFFENQEVSGLNHFLIELFKVDKNALNKVFDKYNGPNPFFVCRTFYPWSLYDNAHKPTKQIIHWLIELRESPQDNGEKFIDMANKAGQILKQLNVQLKTFNECLQCREIKPAELWILALHEFGYAQKELNPEIAELFGRKNLPYIISNLGMTSSLFCGHLIDRHKSKSDKDKGENKNQFDFSSDFKHVEVNGKPFEFNDRQSKANRLLYEAYKNVNKIGINQKEIAEVVNTIADNYRLLDTFRIKDDKHPGHQIMHPFWRKHIEHIGKGIYRLKV